jgi:hypothetical protein
MPRTTWDALVLAPAWMLAELCTMAVVIGSAPRALQTALPAPWAMSA